ncbi:MAG: DNA-3-methyladenine glycosylase [Phycisphaeraceae bacterium]|nr:DNA-3-methyladenine glycosylase [Phycisphaeraceae bacterium]
MGRLKRSFFARESVDLAPALIGTRLVRRLDDGTLLSGIIVEVEAYIGVKDRASHAFGGRRTARNQAMYDEAGTAYVYFTYGMHYCMNIVCAERGVPQAVLLRALEPDPASHAIMRRYRGVESERLLCSGPGRLCQAMAIDRALNGIDLCTSEQAWVESVQSPAREVVRSKRIGIDSAGVWAKRLLRWSEKASRHVSKPVDGKRSVRAAIRGSKNRKTA